MVSRMTFEAEISKVANYSFVNVDWVKWKLGGYLFTGRDLDGFQGLSWSSVFGGRRDNFRYDRNMI